ncbi:hypothetical protein ACE7GA_22045 [Roseomonas sp. CCTCC AB2023176]|uniref:hypothetical protein n=1 Tax=Roseomonas sp. CCTCC AB2023176 TaxID=3342640 RepID=UPI0035DD8819
MTRTALTLLAALAVAGPAWAEEDYGAWAIITDPFPSTGGGGIIIGGYRPVVSGTTCVTDFTATEPNGMVHRNSIVFDAVPAQGGVLCTNGRWRAANGSASGTTPFRVFLRDGVARGHPL